MTARFLTRPGVDFVNKFGPASVGADRGLGTKSEATCMLDRNPISDCWEAKGSLGGAASSMFAPDSRPSALPRVLGGSDRITNSHGASSLNGVGSDPNGAEANRTVFPGDPVVSGSSLGRDSLPKMDLGKLGEDEWCSLAESLCPGLGAAGWSSAWAGGRLGNGLPACAEGFYEEAGE